MNIILFDKALTSSDWLNFWGNIIGAMLGVFGTFLVMFLQLKREREKNSKEKIDTMFFNLLTLFQNVKSEFDTYRFIKAIESEIAYVKILSDSHTILMNFLREENSLSKT